MDLIGLILGLIVHWTPPKVLLRSLPELVRVQLYYCYWCGEC